MTIRTSIRIAPVALLCAFAQAESVVQVNGGVVTFDATTNISAVTVHGKADALKAHVRIHRDNAQLVVDQVSATVPVSALSTGMGLRDDHMKTHIFTTSNGQTPDLVFTGENLVCPVAAGKEAACNVNGKLAIRGTEKPLSLTLKVKSDGNQGYRAAGDGVVKLSDYGIERPSQFGVQVEDKVKIHIEFLGKETVESAGVR
jgi:polyisoprenoid-binding protein YceI